MLFAAMGAALALGACNPAEQAAPEAAEQATPGGEDALSSEATPVYVGTWAEDAAGCAAPQELQGAPHIFTADGFDQHEAHCTFVSAVPLSATEWRVGAQCTVEGDEQNTAFNLSVDGDTLRIDGGPPLQRCPEAE